MEKLADQNDALSSLTNEATRQLPDWIEGEEEARAWVARRVIELAESQRKSIYTVQVLLCNWIVNNDEYGPVWMAHPDKPRTFREFLKSVGNEQEANKLSPSSISDMAAMAEIIVPFAKSNGIDINPYITSSLWTKLRETIPVLRGCAENEDVDTLQDVLSDVKALPTRDAVRTKYRSQGDKKPGISDYGYQNGTAVFVTMVPTEDISAVRRALSSVSEFSVIAAMQFGDDNVDIKIQKG